MMFRGVRVRGGVGPQRFVEITDEQREAGGVLTRADEGVTVTVATVGTPVR